MTRSRLLMVFLCSFFAGVGAGSVLPWVIALCVFLLVGVILGFLKDWFVGGLALFAFLIGFMRIVLTFPSFDVSDVAFYRDISDSLSLQGIIASEPEFRNDAQYVVLQTQILNYGRDIPIKGAVLVKLSRFPEYEYGDALEVRGRLQKPAEFEGFSYGEYLAKDGIYAVMYRPKVRLLERGTPVDGWQLVFGLKELIRNEIERLFTEPGASIVLGLLLGMRSSIPQELMDAFQRSGLTHILAISGYNITLLITIVGVLLKSLGRRIRFLASWFTIAFFALLTGLSASVVRASIMGALTVFILFQGRKTDGILLLLLSGFLMVMANPRILIWDVSFQLSFVSTLGLMIVMPLWEPYLQKLPPFLSEGLAVTLAATLFTTPVALYHFGTFSLISPLANVLFLPFIPIIMFFSFLALMSSFLFLPISFVFVAITWVVLFIFLEGVEMVASIPLAFMKIPFFPWWAVGLYYLFIWTVIGRSRRRSTSLRIPRLAQAYSPHLVDVSESPSMEQSERRMK